MMLKIKLENKPWNHKRVYRVYCKLSLNIRIKPKKRLPKGEVKALVQPLEANACWSMDFMADALISGQKFRTFNVIDDYNRECLLLKADYSLPAPKITQLLDEVAGLRGYPSMIRVDNGTEFTSEVFKAWAEKHHILIHYIQPGKPAQNGLIERFNRTFREDILDMNLFNNLKEVNSLAAQWLQGYNYERPHESLAGLSPILFAKKRKNKTLNNKLENSTFR